MPGSALLEITTRLHIPEHVDSAQVLSALQACEPLIAANPYMVRYVRRPVQLEELVDDAFFRDDGQRLQAYVVHDRVALLPFLKKDVVVPCVFQGFEHGVRCRAHAQAGVVVRSRYEVRRRGEVPRGAHENDTEQSPGRRSVAGDAWQWELVERATIECSALVKPFVKKSFLSAHKLILERLVEQFAREKTSTGEE